MTDRALSTVNEHCLDNIIKLTESTTVFASEDIYDTHGTKLLAKGTDISLDTKERLVSHKLRKPLETSLSVADGVTSKLIIAETKNLLEEMPALRVFAEEKQAAVFEALSSVLLQPTAALLMTTANKSKEGVFRHSVLVALVAISLGAHNKMAHKDLVTIALASLLHDIGELYINPEFTLAKRALTPEEWRHMVLHPRIGEVALTELTNYPREVLNAVGYHHERMDGSGYPRQLSGSQISRTAQILSLAETLSGIIVGKGDVLSRSCLALKCIPGEHSHDLVSVVSALKRDYTGDPFPADAITTQTVSFAKDITNRLRRAITEQEKIAHTPSLPPAALNLLAHAEKRIAGLRQAMKATGVDECLMNEQMLAFTIEDKEIFLEMEVVGKEIDWRMRDIARDLYLRLNGIPFGVATSFSTLIKILDNSESL